MARHKVINMPTRWIFAGFFAFAVAAVLGFVMALAGPVAPMRLLGGITALMGVAGAIIHAQLLQDTDPRVWTVMGSRIAEFSRQLRVRMGSLQTSRRHADAS